MIRIDWLEKYSLAKKFFEFYHNLDIPEDYCTDDGINEKTDGKYNLGSWVKFQRNYYSKLPEEKKEMLDKIGFVPNRNNQKWSFYFDLYVKYYDEFNDSYVPYDFCTSDGVTYDKDGYKLGAWVRLQRNKFNIMIIERKEKLLSNGFVPNVYDGLWEEHFALAKNFYDKFHHLHIPLYFYTTDGITYDENGIDLGRWIINNRFRYDELTEEKKEKLSGIKFSVAGFDSLWYKDFLVIKDYYEKYHNMRVKSTYKDESGLNLSAWVYRQRKGFDDLSVEHKNLLYKNGFIVDFYKNMEYVKLLIISYGLNRAMDYKKLYDCSMQELQAKITYLVEKNMPLIVEDKLNRIFDMSNSDLLCNYGISIEELISKYTVDVDCSMKLLHH